MSYVIAVLEAKANTLGAAVRNANDPQDPSREAYAELIEPRFMACVSWAVERDIDLGEAMDIIEAGVANQCEMLGFIDALRAEIAAS